MTALNATKGLGPFREDGSEAAAGCRREMASAQCQRNVRASRTAGTIRMKIMAYSEDEDPPPPPESDDDDELLS